MGVNVDWSLLQTADIGGAFNKGFEHGREQRRQQQVESAFAAFAADPTSDAPIGALMAVAPDKAMALRGYQQEQAKYQRGDNFRSALSDYQMAGDGQAPARGALVPSVLAGMGGQPAALRPTGAAATSILPSDSPGMTSPGPKRLNQAEDERSTAFRRMMEASPEDAMRIKASEFKQVTDRIKLGHDAYAIEGLGGVRNDEQYQQVVNQFEQMIAPLAWISAHTFLRPIRVLMAFAN